VDHLVSDMTISEEEARQTNIAFTQPAQPSVSRIVHYCFTQHGDLIHRPAVVVRVWNRGTEQEMVQLVVFMDGTNDGPEFASCIAWRTSVHYSEEPQHHTWHWPFGCEQ